MPVRSIRLRLVVPRQPSELDAARALWSTHALVNEAVALYERMPLLRGEAYSAGAESYSQTPLAGAEAGAGGVDRREAGEALSPFCDKRCVVGRGGRGGAEAEQVLAVACCH